MEQELITNKDLYNILTDDAQKKMFQKSLEEVSECENCKTNEYVTVIIMGKPIHTAIEIARLTGFFKLAGRKLTGEENSYLCRKCKNEF
jgi:hypothetical protein